MEDWRERVNVFAVVQLAGIWCQSLGLQVRLEVGLRAGLLAN